MLASAPSLARAFSAVWYNSKASAGSENERPIVEMMSASRT